MFFLDQALIEQMLNSIPKPTNRNAKASRQAEAQPPDQATPQPVDNLVGRFVFLSRRGLPGADATHFILRQGPGVLYGVQPLPGLGGQHVRRFDLDGPTGYDILNVQTDWGRAGSFANALEVFVAQDGKRRYVDEVYANAAEVARQVREIININLGQPGREDILQGQPQVAEAACDESPGEPEQEAAPSPSYLQLNIPLTLVADGVWPHLRERILRLVEEEVDCHEGAFQHTSTNLEDQE